jgi:hypothetical protein
LISTSIALPSFAANLNVPDSRTQAGTGCRPLPGLNGDLLAVVPVSQENQRFTCDDVHHIVLGRGLAVGRDSLLPAADASTSPEEIARVTGPLRWASARASIQRASSRANSANSCPAGETCNESLRMVMTHILHIEAPRQPIFNQQMCLIADLGLAITVNGWLPGCRPIGSILDGQQQRPHKINIWLHS